LASADDDVAALLLGATPVNAQWAADVLCAAANNRVGRSNAHDPARFLRRALLEPVSAAKRAELLVKLADTTTAGRPEAGDLRLTRVLLDDSGCQTASARLAAADLMLINGAGEVTRQMLGTVYRQPGVTDSERAAIAAWCWLADDFCHSGRDTALPDFPAGNDDPDLAGIAAWRTAVHGKDAAGARRLARRALATAGNVDRLLLPRLMAARTLMLTDDAVEATAGIDQVLVDARRRGLPSAVSLALLARVQLNHRRGWSTEAAEDLSTALAELPLHRWHPAAVPMALGFQSLIWLEQGRLDCAARAAGTPLPPAAEQGAGMSYLLFARGLTHLTAGRFEQAVLDLQECGRRMLYKGWHNPAATPWRSLAALAHLACGRQEESDRLFNEDWRLAQQWGTSSVLGLISLWHGKALEGEPAWRKLSFAVRTLRDSPARGWYAGALYKLAAHQAVAGDEQTAEVLLSDCERLDAMQEDRRLMGNVRTLIWRLRVSRRLADVGGRQLPLAGIGERITQMVALGVSTSEIAEALSISRRSAEQHLTTIYRAFGVNGRAELRAVLSNREAVPGKSRNVGEVSRL
jgi:DNA-binding CsgD family transcriptional regulator